MLNGYYLIWDQQRLHLFLPAIRRHCRGKTFLRLPAEEDCLWKAVNRIKKAQQHGARKTPRLWAVANGINDDIAVKTARFIVGCAEEFGVDVIVFEHLDTSGKKKGSKKQRLHLLSERYIQLRLP